MSACNRDSAKTELCSGIFIRAMHLNFSDLDNNNVQGSGFALNTIKNLFIYLSCSVYLFSLSKILIFLRNLHPEKTTYLSEIFNDTIYLKFTENKAIFSPVCNWIVILRDRYSHWMLLFNHPNSWYTTDNNEMQIIILHFSLDRSINIIIDSCLNESKCLI